LVTYILSNTHRVKYVMLYTTHRKTPNIWWEQDSRQSAHSHNQNRNPVTWNAKQKQTRGLVKRNSFPFWALPLYISVTQYPYISNSYISGGGATTIILTFLLCTF